MVQHQPLIPEPIVVLGGGGFIGSNLGKALHAKGYKVSLVDVEYHGWRWPRTSAPVDEDAYWTYWDVLPTYTYDLRSYEAALQAVEGAGTVFHLAADMGGVEYFHSDKDFAASIDNQIITSNVLKACAEAGVQRAVYTSSACAANTKRQMTSLPYPIREVDITSGNPDARYGLEKRLGAYQFAQAPFDARVALLHTVYGPGQEFEGVRRKFPSAVLTNALDAVEKGTDLTIFGDGTQTRSYLYIDDAVERLIQLAEIPEQWLIEHGEHTEWEYEFPWLARVFNIGSRIPVSCQRVAEYALDLAHIWGIRPLDRWRGPSIVHDLSKPTGVRGRVADLTKWESVFGPTDEVHWMEGFEHFMDWIVRVKP